MPTYPATRRFFRDEEFRNDNAAIAGVVRALALSQNYRYARDLKVTPSDAKIYARLAWPWAANSFEYTPVCLIGTGGSAIIAEIVVPAIPAPLSGLSMWINVDRAAGAVVADLLVTNKTTGNVVTSHFTDPTFTNHWFLVSVPASPGDVLRVSARSTSGTPFRVTSITAAWDRTSSVVPGVSFIANTWTAISQAFHATNRPISTYALRWLGRMANAFVGERVHQVAASWLYNPAAGTAAGYNTVPTVVGRYLLHIGGRCPSLTVRLRYRASGACTVNVSLPVPGWSGTVTIPGAGRSVASTTIAMTSWNGASTELILTVNGAPAFCDIEHVLVYENHSTAASLVLPAGETVPANFDPNPDERMSSGRAIRADDIARMVANEVWLWAYRRDCILVNDCRYSYKETRLDAFTGIGGLTDRAALHEIHTSKRNAGDAFGELRIRSGFHQGYLLGTPVPWEALKFQVGLATFADSPGAPAVGLGVQYPEGPGLDWASHSQEAHQHRRGGTVSGDTTYLVETILLTAGHTTTINKMTRPSWTTIEELPLNSPAATYP